MAQDFEQMIKDVFGESLGRLTQFQTDQMKKITDKLSEVAREAVKEDFTKLHAEVAELRARLTRLESERVEAAAERV
jgi:polyhydroxyalkanoate synthesis regulator phasin